MDTMCLGQPDFFLDALDPSSVMRYTCPNSRLKFSLEKVSFDTFFVIH